MHQVASDGYETIGEILHVYCTFVCFFNVYTHMNHVLISFSLA